MDSLARNLKVAVRALSRTPTFTLTVVLTLGLGIGVNSAVFSAIDAVVIRPLPYPEADRLLRLSQSQPKAPQPLLAPVRLEDWNRLNTSFEAITGTYCEDVSELSGDLPEKLKRCGAAPRFLQVLGITPAAGRDFSPEELRFGGPSAILVSHRLAERRFTTEANAVGKTLRIGRGNPTIVGVMPAAFQYPDREVDVWMPSSPDAPWAQNRDNTWYTTIGRLKSSATLETARADIARVQAGLALQFPATDREITTKVEPLKQVTLGGVQRSLWILFGSVSLLLLIACTNIAALLLTRATGREHETAVRYSLGASRGSIASGILSEVLVLAAAGSMVGLGLAAASSTVFRTLAFNLPRVNEIGLNWRIAAYAFGCAAAVTVLCGVVPALLATRRGLSESLSRGSRTQAGGRHAAHSALVAMQVALAVTLLFGAGLLLRSFDEMGRVAPGFDARNVLAFQVSSSWAETSDFAASAARTRRIIEAVESSPGVLFGASTIALPGVPGEYQIQFKLQGTADLETRIHAEERWVAPGYFAALGIPVLSGEVCGDDPKNRTVMVNRAFVSRYAPSGQVEGRHLERAQSFISDASTAQPRVQGEVRGIVADARETGLDKAPVPTVYWCANIGQPGLFYIAKTQTDPTSLVAGIRKKIHEIEPQRSVFDVATLDERLANAYSENRLRTVLLGFFALTAIGLACIGLYGSLSYIVEVRRRELAVRMAMGALQAQVARMLIRQGLTVVLIGCSFGLVFAAMTAPLLRAMLFGVSTTDSVTLAGVLGLVLSASFLSALVPAIRAARLEPMKALRND
jgi:putative ABC transport system permease protein